MYKLNVRLSLLQGVCVHIYAVHIPDDTLKKFTSIGFITTKTYFPETETEITN